MATRPNDEPAKRTVLTGGPGAGKTAVLELARRDLCPHVEVLPEAASIVFGGGFPRRTKEAERRAAQRAIFAVQAELEALAQANDDVVAMLCDRGTVDGLAYWPGLPADFLAEVESSMAEELGRYVAVIHLRVPEDPKAYRGTTLRPETHREALAIDARLIEVWQAHPRRVIIDASADFIEKAERALAAIRGAIPAHTCNGSSTGHLVTGRR